VPENKLLPQISLATYDFRIVPTLRPRWHYNVAVGHRCVGTTSPQGWKAGNGGSSTQHFHCQYMKLKLKTEGKLTPFIPLGKVSLLRKSEKEIGPKGLFPSVEISLVGYAPNFPFRSFSQRVATRLGFS